MAVEEDTRSLERQLQKLARRYDELGRARAEVRAKRDETIRALHAAGVMPARLTELSGLSWQRIDQIRRGARL